MPRDKVIDNSRSRPYDEDSNNARRAHMELEDIMFWIRSTMTDIRRNTNNARRFSKAAAAVEHSMGTYHAGQLSIFAMMAKKHGSEAQLASIGAENEAWFLRHDYAHRNG